MVPFIVTDDVDAAADSLRPFYALYFGGMGAKGTELPRQRADRDGLRARDRRDRRICTSTGSKDEAAAKVPRRLIEGMALIGPREKIRDELERWRESIVTTLLISGDETTLRTAAELVLG